MKNKPFLFMFMFIVLSIPLLITMKQHKMDKTVDFMVDCVPPAVEVRDESN